MGGFGFIGQDDGGDDLFCHRSHLSGADSLVCDAQVCFDEFWDDRKGKMRADTVVAGSALAPVSRFCAAPCTLPGLVNRCSESGCLMNVLCLRVQAWSSDACLSKSKWPCTH